MTLEQALQIVNEFLKRTAYKNLVTFASSYTDYHDFGSNPYTGESGDKTKRWMAIAFTRTLTLANHVRINDQKDIDVIFAALRMTADTNDAPIAPSANVDVKTDAKHNANTKPLISNVKTKAAFALGLLQQFYTGEYQKAATYYLQATTASKPIYAAERLLHSFPTTTDNQDKNLLVAYNYALYKPLHTKNLANYHVADLIKNYGATKIIELLLNDRLLNDAQKQQILLNTVLHPNDFCPPTDFYTALQGKKNSQHKSWITILKTELFTHAKTRAKKLAANLSENDSTEKAKKTALSQFSGTVANANTKSYGARDEKAPALQPLLESPRPAKDDINNGWASPILSAINRSTPMSDSTKIFAGGWWKWNRLFDTPTGNRTGDFFKGLVCALDRLSEQSFDKENVMNTTLRSYLRPK